MKIRFAILLLLCAVVRMVNAQEDSSDIFDIGVIDNRPFEFSDASYTDYVESAKDLYHNSSVKSQRTNDLYYKFTLASPMNISISNCGSKVDKTCIFLLDSNKNYVHHVDNNTYDKEFCSDPALAYMVMKNLRAGTYYVITEGYSKNGYISITIQNNIAHSMTADKNQNYVYTRKMTSNSGSQYIDQIEYFDGLGRSIQTIERGITPDQNDLVNYHEYDDHGRSSNTWLPRVSNNEGTFVPLGTFKNLLPSVYQNDTKAYARPVYEASPLNRVIEQYQPGQDWHNNAKSIKTSYLINWPNPRAPELKCNKYTIIGNGTGTSLAKSSNYADNQLFITIVEDEDGNVSYEFKNKNGQILLNRQKNGSNYFDTHYVYDDFGNICYVLPPMCTLTTDKTYSDNDDLLKKYAYVYKYDSRNRCVKKRLPGCDWIEYKYDKADRLIFTQDGELRKSATAPDPSNQYTKGRWLCNIYDALGRVAILAECEFVSSQGVVKATYGGGPSLFGGYKLEGIGFNWDNFKVLTINYYDHYQLDFIDKNSDDDYLWHEHYTGYGSPISPTIGLQTASVTAVVSANNSSLSNYKSFYYDRYDRLIQTRTKDNDYLNTEALKYNFSGKLTGKILESKYLPENVSIKEEYQYVYDHGLRLLETTHQLNSEPKVTLALNTYDELGRLKTSMPNYRQDLKLSYNYNLRSWLTEIVGQKFNEQLYYNRAFEGGTPLYNGNIASATYNNFVGYNYFYDNLNRLTQASSYFMYNSNIYKGYQDVSYSYDKQGNITYLKRIEDLMIEYIEINYDGNKMRNIANLMDKYPDDEPDYYDNFVSYSQNPSDQIEYNANGGMFKDPYKGAEYYYNSLGMPRQVKVPAIRGTIDYTYLATGERLGASYAWHSGLSLNPMENVNRPNYTTTNSSKHRKYIGNKIYENNKLKRILVDNGYYENGKYYFYLRDHLGNNCVVANGSNGAVVQSLLYYPYGKVIDLESWGQSAQPYKFGDKEEESMFGLGLYDFGARQMDSRVPSFLTIDPHSESYYSWSPYAYCANNPLRIIDPTGEDWRDFLGAFADGFTEKFKQIGNAFAHPVETAKNYMTQSAPNNVGDFALQAADNATMGSASKTIEFLQAAATDINGGDGSATGRVLGGAAADVTIAAGTAKAGQVVGKGLSAVSKEVGKVAVSRTVEQSTALRQVGAALESVNDIMANPSLLKGKSPLQVESIIGKTSGWKIETLGKGSQKGNGWVLREYTTKGNPTGSQLRWHPGGGHHGSGSYWRVVGKNGDLGGIIK